MAHRITTALLKPFQNKKGQKNFRYPTKKQSFSKKKDCLFVGYLKLFGSSYFETALVFLTKILVIETQIKCSLNFFVIKLAAMNKMHSLHLYIESSGDSDKDKSLYV